MGNLREKIVLVGSYPPPHHGMSVYLERLYGALSADFEVAVVDPYGLPAANDVAAVVRCGPPRSPRALGALRRQRARVVHFHVAAMDAFLWSAYPLLFAVGRRARPLLTIHSGSFVGRFSRGPAWRRALLRDLMSRFFRIVTVSEEQYRFLRGLGVESERLRIIPAFLPPRSSESPRAREAMAALSGCTRILVASGVGLPLYGFHVLLDALAAAAGDGRSGVLLCLYKAYDESYLSELRRRAPPNVSLAIVRDLGPDEFAWILGRCDAYVRPTDRDGDAVALREALYYGKPVVASDCVERPAGVRLFKTGDAGSLAEALATAAEPAACVERDDGRAGFAAVRELYYDALRA